jgi:hypothetical protein
MSKLLTVLFILTVAPFGTYYHAFVLSLYSGYLGFGFTVLEIFAALFALKLIAAPFTPLSEEEKSDSFTVGVTIAVYGMVPSYSWLVYSLVLG